MTEMTSDEFRLRGQQGTALLCALMVTTLLGTLGAALVFLVTTESMISANHRTAQQALYAADAGVERAMAGLRTLPDWRSVRGPARNRRCRIFSTARLLLALVMVRSWISRG